jgi:hypothetical protein
MMGTEDAREAKKKQLIPAYSGQNRDSAEEAVHDLLGLQAQMV